MTIRSAMFAVIGFVFLVLLGALAWQTMGKHKAETTIVTKERDDAEATGDNLRSRSTTDQVVKTTPPSQVKEELLEWSL